MEEYYINITIIDFYDFSAFNPWKLVLKLLDIYRFSMTVGILCLDCELINELISFHALTHNFCSLKSCPFKAHDCLREQAFK